jgi:two-component system, OmpR family, sensor kinase
MLWNSTETSYGRVIAGRFMRWAAALGIVLLLVGHYRAAQAAADHRRVAITPLNADHVMERIKDDFVLSQNYFYGSMAVGVLGWLAVCVGTRKMQLIGDQLEGLSRHSFHDLKHDMGDISASALRILDGEPDARRLAREIDARATSVNERVNAYLRLAKGFEGFDKSTAEDVDVAETAWRVFEDVKDRAPNLQVKCLAPMAGIVVRAHPFLVGEIIWNLLDNAIKYTDSGSVTLNVTRSGKCVRISVADTGRGIPPSDLKRVFDRFYRAESARDKPGSGLGLATVREIAEGLYRGTATCTSTLGRGTTITLERPTGRSAAM